MKGEHPYSKAMNTKAIQAAITRKELPGDSSCLPSLRILDGCWEQEAASRLSIRHCLAELEGVTQRATPPERGTVPDGVDGVRGPSVTTDIEVRRTFLFASFRAMRSRDAVFSTQPTNPHPETISQAYNPNIRTTVQVTALETLMTAFGLLESLSDVLPEQANEVVTLGRQIVTIIDVCLFQKPLVLTLVTSPHRIPRPVKRPTSPYVTKRCAWFWLSL